MKKRVKKLVVIALTVALFVTSVLPALAEDAHIHHKDDTEIPTPTSGEKYTISLVSPGEEVPEGYMSKVKFGAYQIFSGTVDTSKTVPDNPGSYTGNDEALLPITDIKWGTAFNEKDDTDGVKRMKNIVGFALALGNVKPGTFFNVDLGGFRSGESTALVDASGNLSEAYYEDAANPLNILTYPTASKEVLQKVNYDKLAVAVAQEVAKHNDREWLQAFADILGGYTGDNSSDGYAEGGYVHSFYGGDYDETDKAYEITVPAGYYMLIDRTGYEEDSDENVAYSARMLFVAYNIKQEIKESVPTLTKNVVRADGTLHKTEAAGVGDLVNFRLTGTLPSNYLNYLEGYQYKFEDTPKGLTIKEKSEASDEYVTVKAKGWLVADSTGGSWTWNPDLELTILKSSYSTTGDPHELSHKHIDESKINAAYSEILEDGTLTVYFPCLEEILVKGDSKNGVVDKYYRLGCSASGDESSEIYVNYTAEVNSDALVGTAGNVNEAFLHYSNNPQSYHDMTKTTEDTAKVFTFGLNITKVDAADFIKNGASAAGLENAKFVLVKCDKEETNFVWKIAEFTKVNKDSISEDSGIPEEFENGYYKIDGWKVLHTGTDETFDKAWLDVEGATRTNNFITTLTDGYLNVSGIDENVTYTLVETEAPEGYATIKPFEVTVTAATIASGEITEYNGKLSKVESGSAVEDGESFSYENTVQLTPIDPDINDGSAGMLVANFKYENLPSTGGIGTWIYYIIGGVTVAGALVLFILAGRKSRKA